MATFRVLRRWVFVLLIMTALFWPLNIRADASASDASFPDLRDVFGDDFESGSLSLWTQVSSENLDLVSGAGYNGTTGFRVSVDRDYSYIYQRRVGKLEEGYITFWFNPNNVSIPYDASWPPGSAIRVANVKGMNDWHVLVGLEVLKYDGQYRAFLQWRDGNSSTQRDYENGQFDLTNGWQKITLGYRAHDWIAVWVNDVQMRFIDDITHDEDFGEIIEFGKTDSTSSSCDSPSGTFLMDDVAFQVRSIPDLWVDAQDGNDENDGLTQGQALRTVQRAADLAGPGTTVHILPGVYRETVVPAASGDEGAPVRYLAQNGPGTVALRGSIPSSSLTWTPLGGNSIGLPPGVNPSDIYMADLSSWDLDETPRFVVELDASGDPVARLPLAREPDWEVVTEWKYHEFWWAADGGSEIPSCDPRTDTNPHCDYNSRSTTQLIDRTNDTVPAGVESGNLTTLGDLTGGTLVSMDASQAHYIYRRRIVDHSVSSGRITVNDDCYHDDQPGLGWGSKYYVEDRPYLLDSPGEWWYDRNNQHLYLWPRTPGNPAAQHVEISLRDHGFVLKNRSYITLDGLTLEFMNEDAISQDNYERDKSYGNGVHNAVLRYANRGLRLSQSVDADGASANITKDFVVENTEIAYMDTHALYMYQWWGDSADPDEFTHSGIVDTVIRNNELHHLGFRTDGENAVGVAFNFTDRLRFENNHVHHVAHNGVQFSKSVIQSGKTYDFSPAEIKTGEILIKGNTFEKACQLTADCAALKFWGRAPDTHVFRDVLITANVFRNTIGWTYVSEQRGRWSGGESSERQGMGGLGLYLDSASGIHVYRNVVYNTGSSAFNFAGHWRDGDIIYFNNLAADALNGFAFGSGSYDTHGCVNLRVGNNIIVNNEGYGVKQSDEDGVYTNMSFDHNLYYNNGWRPYEQGGVWSAGAMVIWLGDGDDAVYPTLADIQAHTSWETHGVTGDPGFWSYDVSDHDMFDGSWPDFRLSAGSANAIDRGTDDLPDSLEALLALFGVDDPYWGESYDIGPYESEIALRITPPASAMDPGSVTSFDIYVEPVDLPHTFTLDVDSSAPELEVVLQPANIGPGDVAKLTITDTHSEDVLMPGAVYKISISATGGDLNLSTTMTLVVGGSRAYLPFSLR